MARRNRKARSRQANQAQKRRRKARKAGKGPSWYHHGLRDAIGKFFPGQFFSRWPVIGGALWSGQRVFWLALLMVWSAEQTLDARFVATRQVVRSLFPKWSLGSTYTGWYQAQLKWLPLVKGAVTKRLQQQMQQRAGKHWHREGWCAFAVDGSRFESPRTKANERELKCAGKEKTGPQLFLTTLLHMGTGLPWDFRIGPGTDSERRHLEDMLAALPPWALVVADAGFTGYELFRRLLAANQNFLIRVGANVHLLKKLGYFEREGPDTVYLWPEKHWHEPPVVLRLIVLGEGKKKVYLATNVQDHKALSEKTAKVLYEMRWGVEVFYRSLKQTLQKRKMLSRSPEAAKCELTWTMYGMWLLGLLSVSKILARGRDPLRWSVAAARERIRKSLRLALAGRQDSALSHDLGQAVRDDYVRRRSKKARNWPHKKKETPAGAPKIQMPNQEQRKDLQRLKAKEKATELTA